MKLKKFELIKYINEVPYSVLVGWMLEDCLYDWVRKLEEFCPELHIKLDNHMVNDDYELLTVKR